MKLLNIEIEGKIYFANVQNGACELHVLGCAETGEVKAIRNLTTKRRLTAKKWYDMVEAIIVLPKEEEVEEKGFDEDFANDLIALARGTKSYNQIMEERGWKDRCKEEEEKVEENGEEISPMVSNVKVERPNQKMEKKEEGRTMNIQEFGKNFRKINGIIFPLIAFIMGYIVSSNTPEVVEVSGSPIVAHAMEEVTYAELDNIVMEILGIEMEVPTMEGYDMPKIAMEEYSTELPKIYHVDGRSTVEENGNELEDLTTEEVEEYVSEEVEETTNEEMEENGYYYMEENGEVDGYYWELRQHQIWNMLANRLEEFDYAINYHNSLIPWVMERTSNTVNFIENNYWQLLANEPHWQEMLNIIDFGIFEGAWTNGNYFHMLHQLMEVFPCAFTFRDLVPLP